MCFISVYIMILSISGLSWSANIDISSDEIISHIRYLASDELRGRKAGSPGGGKAANYIASNYKRAGLKPFGDDGTYFQNFSFPSGVKLGKLNSLTAI